MSLEEGRALLEYENCSSMIVLNVLMMLCCREQAPHSLSQSIRVRLSQMPFRLEAGMAGRVLRYAKRGFGLRVAADVVGTANAFRCEVKSEREGTKFFNIGVQHPLKSIPEAPRDTKNRFQKR